MTDNDGQYDYQKALECEEHGNYHEASIYLESSFNKGCHDAIDSLKINKHMDVSKENSMRIHTLIEMASAGNAVAEFCVGARFLYGINVKKDVDRAIFWLDKAVENGNSDACYHLGKYVEKNPIENHDPIKLISKAADLKHPLAQNDLARKHLDGTLEYDPSKSLELYLEAGREGYWIATRHAAEMFYHGKHVERDLDKAFELYCIASNTGDPKSCLMVAEMLENGEGTEKNIYEAIRMYALLAINYTRNGRRFCNEAAYRLGMIFEKGIGVQSDYEDAYYWYSRAAEKGHEKAEKAMNRIKNINGL